MYVAESCPLVFFTIVLVVLKSNTILLSIVRLSSPLAVAVKDLIVVICLGFCIFTAYNPPLRYKSLWWFALGAFPLTNRFPVNAKVFASLGPKVNSVIISSLVLLYITSAVIVVGSDVR